MTPSATVAGGVGRPTRWSRENIIEKIREWVALYGEPPRAADWNPSAAKWSGASWRIARYRSGDWPSLNATKAAFGGSLNEAIRAAGFEPNRPGPPARRKVAAPDVAREQMPPEARVVLDAALAEVRDLRRTVEARDRMLERSRAGAERLRSDLAAARRVRPVTKTKTKVVRERVADDAAVARARKQADRKVERVEARLAAAAGEVVEAKAKASEASRKSVSLAARLERAEATISSLRDDRRSLTAALRRTEDRLVAAERIEASVPEVREVEVVREVRSASDVEVAEARRRVREAEVRVATAERELREVAALVTGEARRLTDAEKAELKARGPAGPAVLAAALKQLAVARKTSEPVRLRAALTAVASAAVSWRERV